MRNTNIVLLLLLCILFAFQYMEAACPNNCNMRGKCTNEGICECDEAFRGSVDCSLRKCLLWL